MARFIAIPVGQGDSFYFEREGWSVLVDGGRSRKRFAGMFERVTQKANTSIVVCTHNDADHANGVLGFLEDGLDCDEIWLPGRWLEALPDVLAPTDTTWKDLYQDIEEATKTTPDGKIFTENETPLERYASDNYEKTVRQVKKEDSPTNEKLDSNGWSESLRDKLERADNWDEYFPYDWPQHLIHWIKMLHSDKKVADLFFSVIEAEQRIKKIALSAFHRGLKVRWFEYDTVNVSDGTNNLKPLNSRELKILPPRERSLFYTLALSVTNKESLVFWSPTSEEDRGVLFTADSDLHGANLPNSIELEGSIVTTPHHGSKANAIVYQKIAAQTTRWVRSDGCYKNRPCDEFLDLGHRFCTVCRQGKTFSSKIPVSLFSRSGQWCRSKRTKECSCN